MDVRSPYNIPPAGREMKIGLFGGSFNPPHLGHFQVSKIALKKMDLDQLWWLVSPGNPLKDKSTLASLDARILKCREIANHPDIRICAFEQEFNTRYTADTLEILTTRRPLAKFVWVMGADNLAQFHKWERWRDIAQTLPLAIIDRPGSTVSPNSTPATHSLSKFRLDEVDAQILPHANPPAWVYIHAKRSYLSSTQLRQTKRIP